jgi:delta 1-pyrroline-5-carboxylate dehydrogenase
MPLSFATGLTTARELDIVLRAASQAPSLAPTGGVNAQLIDSVAVSIAFRDR